MSVPKRFFVDKIADEVVLSGDEYRHAKNVLRLGAGDEVTLLDSSGAEYSAVVARAERGRLVLNVTGARDAGREPAADVTLLIGALKGDKTELVVQKAAELGVNRVGVFSSRYAAAYMNENKLERLNRVSREAAKQCLRSVSPPVSYFPDLVSALDWAAGAQTKLFACEFLGEEAKIGEIAGSCTLVVGSEGGFTREEYGEAVARGYRGVTLGKRILRAETAAIALCAVAAHALGELG